MKLLPPLIAGPEEVDYFVEALDDIMADAQRGSGLAYEFGRTMVRGALGSRFTRRAPVGGVPAPATPSNGESAPARARAAAEAPTGEEAPAQADVPAVVGVGGRQGSANGTGHPAEAATTIEPGDRIVLTGATGFIGSAVARALQVRGAQVVAVVEPGADPANLHGLECERAEVDIRDAAGLKAVCTGARHVFHLAAIYRFWARDPRVFEEVNVGGTINVLEAFRSAGCERMVYTSTVGVLGLGQTRQGGLADETSCPDITHLFGRYKQTKLAAEHEVLRAAAEGMDVSIVLPTFPLGPGDRAPTPTGKVVLEFLNGRIPGFVDTAMNVCHVDDLARGHLAALEHGRPGRSYILGGENLSMREILQGLADCSGLPMPGLEIPHSLALAAGFVSDLIEGRLLGREPTVPLEAARMSTTKMIFNDDRARAEIGHKSRPARLAIEDSARWFAEHGYVSPRRLAAIRWKD
ncbi:MAG TPA: SDR family oxidoreductase [Streptosporangiaceae bacterium]